MASSLFNAIPNRWFGPINRVFAQKRTLDIYVDRTSLILVLFVAQRVPKTQIRYDTPKRKYLPVIFSHSWPLTLFIHAN